MSQRLICLLLYHLLPPSCQQHEVPSCCLSHHLQQQRSCTSTRTLTIVVHATTPNAAASVLTRTPSTVLQLSAMHRGHRSHRCGPHAAYCSCINTQQHAGKRPSHAQPQIHKKRTKKSMHASTGPVQPQAPCDTRFYGICPCHVAAPEAMLQEGLLQQPQLQPPPPPPLLCPITYKAAAQAPPGTARLLAPLLPLLLQPWPYTPLRCPAAGPACGYVLLGGCCALWAPLLGTLPCTTACVLLLGCCSGRSGSSTRQPS